MGAARGQKKRVIPTERWTGELDDASRIPDHRGVRSSRRAELPRAGRRADLRTSSLVDRQKPANAFFAAAIACFVSSSSAARAADHPPFVGLIIVHTSVPRDQRTPVDVLSDSLLCDVFFLFLSADQVLFFWEKPRH